MLLAILAGLLVLVGVRRRRAPLVVAVNQSDQGFTRQWMRPLAVITLVVMMVATGIYTYLAWRDSHEIVTLEVVDSRTGGSVRYQARRGDIEARTFLTLDGRQVTLAETERLIMGSP